MSILPEVISAKEVNENKQIVESLKDKMSAIKVTSQEELTQVAVHIKAVREKKALITKARDKYITPAKEIIEMAKSTYDPFIKLCEEIEAELKGKGQKFIDAEEKRVAEKTAKELSKVETGYQGDEKAAENIAKIDPAVKKASTADGATLGSKKVKEVVIYDQSLIPEEYYKPRELDMVKIKKIATAGVEIPGVRVELKTQMEFRG